MCEKVSKKLEEIKAIEMFSMIANCLNEISELLGEYGVEDTLCIYARANGSNQASLYNHGYEIARYERDREYKFKKEEPLLAAGSKTEGDSGEAKSA